MRGKKKLEMVMNRLTDGAGQESPLAMMFADDIQIGRERMEQVGKTLETWRYGEEE